MSETVRPLTKQASDRFLNEEWRGVRLRRRVESEEWRVESGDD
ncbi:MAG: hypothetical protein ACI4F6_10535 [Acutalibacteraceae bacterium]